MGKADKIIVAPHQIFDYDLEIQEVGHNGAEEYIRKDALLEWAKEGLKTTEKLKGDSSVFSGENIVFKCLIDKLNSM